MDSRDQVYVLITGGAGYIGSHSAKALARAGFYPVVIDDLGTGHRSDFQNNAGATLALLEAMREHDVTRVIAPPLGSLPAVDVYGTDTRNGS